MGLETGQTLKAGDGSNSGRAEAGSQMRHVVVRGGGHRAQYPWPLDCFVQAGRSGLVITPAGSEIYETAFFEAFPRNPSTFLRGEGVDVAAAKTAAWGKFQRTQDCPYGTSSHPQTGWGPGRTVDVP